jgi:serine/threonine transporter
MRRFISVWNRTTLIKRIAIGVVVGLILGLLIPKVTVIGLLGEMFVGGLKAIAPLLVFALVANAISQHREGQQTNIRSIIILYLLGTLAAALMAVLSYYVFPISLRLTEATTDIAPPQGVGEVFQTILLNIVDNPLNAIATANYIGVLAWACIFGFAMRAASENTKELLHTMAEVTSQIVRWIINLAPFGIMGLMFETISDNGIAVLADYVLFQHYNQLKSAILDGF